MSIQNSASVNKEIVDDDMTLRQHALQRPDQLAIVDSFEGLTWRQLDQRLNQVAHTLIALGIEPNQRIAILGRNSLDYATLYLGGLRAGICIVPLSTMLTSETLTDMVNDSDARALFVSEDCWSLVEPVVDNLTGLVPQGIKCLNELQRLIADGSADLVEVEPDLGWGFNLIYSSGTTGNPKGILQNRAYRARENAYLADLAITAQSRGLFSTPLYSNTTLFLFFGIVSRGGTAYLMEKFDTARFLQLSEQHSITHTVLVPVQYERLLKDPALDTTDLSAYQLKFSTSAALHKPVKEALLQRWPEGGLVELYGMTEGGVLCNLIAHERPDKLDTVGQPAPSCDLRIIDENGTVLSQGNVGEVVGRSNRMMDGYYHRPEVTEEASWYDESGKRFQRSGDVGWLDDEGFLHLLDRKKDMIISGGFNVYAIDLERVLLSHPDVEDAAVVAATSERWGETPLAFVVAAAGALDAEGLRVWANSQLGKAQRISEIRLIDELPRSPIGKVLKRELRDGLTPNK